MVMLKKALNDVWTEALKMANSGLYKYASEIEDMLHSLGYSQETHVWRDDGERERLNQLCREKTALKNKI